VCVLAEGCLKDGRMLGGIVTIAEFKRPLLREVQKSGLNQVY
jgi:hypothetical protein